MEFKSICKTEIIWEEKQYIIEQLKVLGARKINSSGQWKTTLDDGGY